MSFCQQYWGAPISIRVWATTVSTSPINNKHTLVSIPLSQQNHFRFHRVCPLPCNTGHECLLILQPNLMPTQNLLVKRQPSLARCGRNEVKLEEINNFLSSYILLQQLLWFCLISIENCHKTSKPSAEEKGTQYMCCMLAPGFLCQDMPQVVFFRVY